MTNPLNDRKPTCMFRGIEHVLHIVDLPYGAVIRGDPAKTKLMRDAMKWERGICPKPPDPDADMRPIIYMSAHTFLDLAAGVFGDQSR